MKMPVAMLKNGLTHRIMMKEEEKDHYLQKRKKSNQHEGRRESGKIITKFTTTKLKTLL